MTQVKVLITCACGQTNRLIVDSVSKCGRCGLQLSGFTATLGNLSDRLKVSDASEAFGRMTRPAEYSVCSCGVTFNKLHDADRHKNCGAK